MNPSVKHGFSPLARLVAVGLGLTFVASAAVAQEAKSEADNAAELAKKLSNPIASLISVPIKYNWDTGIGSNDATRETLIVQPVIPFELNADTNLITRTIIPYVEAESPVFGGGTESGLGDITQSFFFSPKAPTASGWIWGAGPVFLYPSANNDNVGREKWGVGPTAVLLKQDKGVTYGLLANHIWSVAGNDARKDISDTFLQPFWSYTTKTFTTVGINTESTYDWKASEWTVPINLSVQQMVKIAKQPVAFALGYRNYVSKPEGGPDWGMSFTMTLLFPK
jgi:hypothetical protein